jgi:hypothetical protein
MTGPPWIGVPTRTRYGDYGKESQGDASGIAHVALEACLSRVR